MRVARIAGIFLSWVVWTAATMNMKEVLGSPQRSGWAKFAVWAGFILGNYVYTKLWMDEARDRERARPRSPSP